jgi:spore germination cell wall hydrolase CwlJ-like protein
MADRERATDCLAATGYYEAGTRAADQRAVMQVVLNRVRHPAFPHSICGVVFQGAERKTGCQFTFACDGSMARRQPSAAIWRQARITASEMLTGQIEPAVGNATHYHTDWVHPAWSSQMNKIAAIDTHLFFRWRGNIGEPQSFTTR